MGYIYKITNQLNNKIYIGQTSKTRPTDRFSQHKYLANHPEQENSISYLHRAMAKNNVNNFTFEIIEEVSNDQLDEKEQYYIKFYNSLTPNGYNMTEGGGGTRGYSRPPLSEEEKLKRKISILEYFKNHPEEKLKRKASILEYYKNHPEAKDEISKRSKELWNDENYRKKVIDGMHKFHEEHPDIMSGENNPMYGKKHTEEALQKIKAHAATRKQKIMQLNKDTLEEIQIFDGVKDAEKFLGVSHGWLSKAARQNKVAYGYKWKFI